MAEDPKNLVLEQLRHIRAAVDETRADVKNVLLRMGVVESHLANFHVAEASQNIEIERIKDRLDPIERRREPAET